MVGLAVRTSETPLVLTARHMYEKWELYNPVTDEVEGQGVAGIEGLFLETRRCARVFRHPQVIENQADVECKLSHFLGNARTPLDLMTPMAKRRRREMFSGP